MTYIKQFTLTAPARVNDSQPFVTLKIREAATATGSYSQIDSQAWTDATPSTVTATAVETSLATLEDGYYKFQWVDGTGAVTQWWGPVFSGGTSEVFTIAEALDEIGDPGYDQDKIIEARAFATAELERALGYSLVPKTSTDVVSVRGHQLRLPRPFVRSITAVSISNAGVSFALTGSEIAALTTAGGYVYGYWWPDGRGHVTVTYSHGLDELPPGGKRAALALALDYLQVSATGTVDPRAESIVTVDGTVRLRTGGAFQNPVVDDWVNQNRLVPVG